MSRRERGVLTLVVLAGLLLLGVSLLDKQGWREVRRLRSARQELATEIEQKRLRRDALRREVAHLREDPRAIESRAREDLGMIKEGETVFLLPERHGPDR